MKKRLLMLILPFTILLLFTACKSISDAVKSKTPDLNKAFTSNITINHNNNEIEAIVTRYGNGIWDLEILSPDTLAGMVINYGTNGVNVMLGELEFSIPFENIINGSVFNVIFSVIDNAAAMPEMDFVQSDNGPTYSGTTSVGDYTLTFDPETNMLTHISVPEQLIEVFVKDINELSSNIHDIEESTNTETTQTIL